MTREMREAIYRSWRSRPPMSFFMYPINHHGESVEDWYRRATFCRIHQQSFQALYRKGDALAFSDIHAS